MWCGILWVDGTTNFPRTLDWPPGSQHNLTVETWFCEKSDYYFQYWTSPSIGTVPSRTIIYTTPSFPNPGDGEAVSAYFQPPATSTVQVTVTSNPAALGDLFIDGAPARSPWIFEMLVGSHHEFDALPTNGTFLSWTSSSIGTVSSPDFDYVAPGYGETVTANYQPGASTTPQAQQSAAANPTVTAVASSTTTDSTNTTSAAFSTSTTAVPEFPVGWIALASSLTLAVALRRNRGRPKGDQ